MNRLWVWITLLIAGVILIVALFPVAYRVLSMTYGWEPRPPPIPFNQIDPEQFRAQIEHRSWQNLSRTLAVGAIFGLFAGMLFTRNLAAPLRKLEDGARVLARGDLSHRVPEKGSAETRSVARSFNQMAAELERQQSLRHNLLADVTHELRHPVHLLQGNLRAILDQVFPLNIQEIERLLDQTHSLTELVDDLHELALAEAHELPMELQPLDLRPLVAAVGEIYQGLAEANGVILSVHNPDAPLVVRFDPIRIRQALQNILNNAVRYTPQGGEIRLSLMQADHFARIQVQDNGFGIDSKDLPRVFDRFYRVEDSRDRQIPGSGLGLAISRAIIQAHDGEVSVASDGGGHGSTFTILLPLRNNQAASQPDLSHSLQIQEISAR